MGRLNHLTRLALGRSAFDEPLTDTEGHPIINSHAFDTDAIGYVQSFNERGHPANENSVKSERRLRRAQNEILQIVGVVRRKHNREARLKQNHGLSKSDVLELVTFENEVGSLVRGLLPIPLSLPSWSITSYRSRLVTFRSHLEPGLMSALRKDTQTTGIWSILTSGWLNWVAADEIRDVRFSVAPALHSHPSSYNVMDALSDDRQLPGLSDYCKDFSLFSLEWAFRAFATLQRLNLISIAETASATTLLQVARTSTFQVATVFRDSDSWVKCIELLFTALSTPLILAYLGDQLRSGLESLLESLLRQELERPCNPDQMSISGWFAGDKSQAFFSQQSFRMDASRIQLSFAEQFQLAFPLAYRIMSAIRFTRFGKRSRTRRQDILHAAKANYTRMLRMEAERPALVRQTESELRRSAMELAFREANLDPRDNQHDVQAWADDVSTATPDMEDLFERENDRLRSPHPEPFQSLVPIDTLLEPIDLPEALPIAVGLSSPPTPVPGLSRAPSLSQAPSRPTSRPRTAPRPVRRPTELDDNISAIASSLRNTGQQVTQSTSHRNSRDEGPIVYHRVTSLSTFPADALAYCGSTLATSIIMLPFDIYYTRQLASAFLATGTSARITVTAADILPLRLTTDVFSAATLSWCGRLALTFGLEALIKSIFWSVSTRMVLHFGKSTFMWGKA